jgi:carbonic anhydrase/acetyltransferase-like protein (isoleucine patch superfamily)
VAKGTFVAMGAVVPNAYTEEYSLIGGVPAKQIKKLSKSMEYFDRPMLTHAHHPADYRKRRLEP